MDKKQNDTTSNKSERSEQPADPQISTEKTEVKNAHASGDGSMAKSDEEEMEKAIRGEEPAS